MNPARHHFLTGTMLPGDEDVGVGGGDPLHQTQHRPHGWRLGDQRRQPLTLEQFVLLHQPLAPARGMRPLDLVPEGGEQPGVVPGLLDEVAGAQPHRLDRLVDAAPGSHDDDRQGRVEGADPGEEIQPFTPGGGIASVVEVDEGGVGLLVLHQGQEAFGHMSGHGPIALALEEQPERLEDVRLVVGDQD